MDFIPVKEAHNLNLTYIGVIPYIIRNGKAYVIFGVRDFDPIIVDLGTTNSGESIEEICSQSIKEKTCNLINLSPEDFLENGDLLYNKESEDIGIVFICIDNDENIIDLPELITEFRKKSINKRKMDGSFEITHLLWMSELNFFYYSRNTTFTDKNGEKKIIPIDEHIDSEGRIIIKGGNRIPMNQNLIDLYKIKKGEVPITPFGGYVPPCFSKYPPFSLYLLEILNSAIINKIDLFYTN